MSSLHFYLSNLPTEIDSNNWEDIIKRALYLFESHPPDTLDQLNQDWKIKWLENRIFSNKETKQIAFLFVYFLVNISKDLLCLLFDDDRLHLTKKLSQNHQIFHQNLFFGVRL